MSEIKFKILADGGFVAGDIESGLTSYAYPSSPHAVAARKNPAKVAAQMIRGEQSFMRTYSEYAKEYDRKNWETLNEDVIVAPAQKRESDGKYAFDGNFDRLCVCGHTLGAHSAGSPADCLFYSLAPLKRKGQPGEDRHECGCTKFRLSRKKS